MIKYVIVGISICKCVCSYDVTIKHDRAIQHELFQNIRGAHQGDTIVKRNAEYYFKGKFMNRECFVDDKPDTAR